MLGSSVKKKLLRIKEPFVCTLSVWHGRQQLSKIRRRVFLSKPHAAFPPESFDRAWFAVLVSELSGACRGWDLNPHLPACARALPALSYSPLSSASGAILGQPWPIVEHSHGITRSTQNTCTAPPHVVCNPRRNCFPLRLGRLAFQNRNITGWQRLCPRSYSHSGSGTPKGLWLKRRSR